MEKVEGLVCRACGRGDTRARLVARDEPIVPGNALEPLPGWRPASLPPCTSGMAGAWPTRSLADPEPATQS
jgi:hypothetical protein